MYCFLVLYYCTSGGEWVYSLFVIFFQECDCFHEKRKPALSPALAVGCYKKANFKLYLDDMEYNIAEVEPAQPSSVIYPSTAAII